MLYNKTIHDISRCSKNYVAANIAIARDDVPHTKCYINKRKKNTFIKLNITAVYYSVYSK